MNEDQIKVGEGDSKCSSQTTTPPKTPPSQPLPEDEEEEELLASPVKQDIPAELSTEAEDPPSPIEPLLGDDQQTLEMKLKDLESKQNLRLYLMKSWNVMPGHAGNVPELSNSDIRKLLMSPPQSPSINSTSKEAATSGSAPIEEQLDSTNESDNLVMALDDDDEADGDELKDLATTTSTTTTLKTLNPPLNDGIYTYWAVVKAQSATAAATTGSLSSNNYLAKINFGRYLSNGEFYCMSRWNLLFVSANGKKREKNRRRITKY